MADKKTAGRQGASFARVFLDIDGVIADFDAHAKAKGKTTAEGRMNWDTLDYQWWVTMPAFTGAKGFYDALAAQAPVTFLTAPVLSEDCFSGKAKWVQNFVPEKGRWILMDLIICPSQDKKNLAAPNAILIDDREMNVREWTEAGGIGIHHKGDYAQTLAEVKKALDGLAPPSGGLSRSFSTLKP